MVHLVPDSAAMPEPGKLSRAVRKQALVQARAHGITGLHRALLAGRLRSAARLLERGADPDAMSVLGTPLFLAVRAGAAACWCC